MKFRNVCALLAAGAAFVGSVASDEAPFRRMRELTHERAHRRAALGEQALHKKIEGRADTSKFRYYSNSTASTRPVRPR